MVRFHRSIGRMLAVVAVSVLGLVLTGFSSAQHTSAAQVKITFTDTTLRVSPAMPQSGLTTFVVSNTGKRTHMLVVSGPGVKSAHTAKLAAGGTAKLTVTLRPGAYVLSDPIGLGAYNVQFLDIVQATSVSATGNSSVVTTPAALPPMCGNTYTP